MPHFTDEEEQILNEWARTQPALRNAFPYTSASDDGRGLGTLLNKHNIGPFGIITAEAFYVKSGGELSIDGLHTSKAVLDTTLVVGTNASIGNDLTVTSDVTIGGVVTLAEQAVAPPNPTANDLVLWVEDHNGHSTFHLKDVDGIEYELPQDSAIICKNDSGGIITKGQPVYISGGSGNVPNVRLARANSTTTMPAIGLANETFANNAFGHIMIAGVLKNWNTAAYADGDQLWVSAVTAGVLVTTRPAYPNIQQRVGIITNGGSVGGGSSLVTGDIADFTHVTAVTDGVNNHPDPMRISFNRDHFYISGDLRGDPVVNLLSPSGGGISSITFSDGTNTYSTSELDLNGNQFYLSRSSTGKPVVNLSHEVIAKHITLQNPASREAITWFVAEDDFQIKELVSFLRTEDASFYPYCKFTIRHRSGIPSMGSGTELTTGGWRIGFYPGHPYLNENPLNRSTFDSNSISGGEFVWLETTKLGEGNGREKELHITLKMVHQ